MINYTPVKSYKHLLVNILRFLIFLFYLYFFYLFHLTGSSGNTPIPSQASSPQLDTNYQSANSVDYTLDSSSKGEIGRSSSERGNEKSDHQQQSSSHTRNHQRHSRSPTPPSAYNLPRR